jgi:hypothetical protein
MEEIKMKVGELKELLNEWLDVLENYEESDNIQMESNTYFLGGARYFLGKSGYDGGYINLSSLEEQIKLSEEE